MRESLAEAAARNFPNERFSTGGRGRGGQDDGARKGKHPRVSAVLANQPVGGVLCASGVRLSARAPCRFAVVIRVANDLLFHYTYPGPGVNYAYGAIHHRARYNR